MERMMTDPGNNDTPTAVIEDNKVVRRARAAGCTCVWRWVDNGEDDGGTMPGIVVFAEGCPVHPDGQ